MSGSLSSHKLLLNRPADSSSSSTPTNVISYGTNWTRDSSSDWVDVEQCSENTISSCMLLPIATEERRQPNPEWDVSVHYFGTGISAMFRWEYERNQTCDLGPFLEIDLLVFDGKEENPGFGTSYRSDPSAEGRYMLALHGLDMRMADKYHTLTVSPSVSISVIAPGCVPFDLESSFFLDYAVASLAPRSPISFNSDSLIVDSQLGDHPWIKYEGRGWAPGAELETGDGTFLDVAFGTQPMRTSALGDSVQFAFAGTSIHVYGMLNANTSQIGLIPSCILSISVDGGRPENRTIISEALAGSINLQSLFEANNLDPDRVHVVNVTTAEFKSTDGSPSSFSLLGFVYSPAFGTLEDGERIMTTWRDNGEELAPSDEKYTTDLLPDPSPTGGPPDHSTNNEGPPIAPIAGGVVGVVAFLVLVGLIFWLRRRRNLARRQAPVRDDAWLYEPSNPNTSQVQPSLYPPVTPYVKSYNDSSATQSTSDMIPPVPYLKSYGTSESTWTPNYGTGTHTDHSPFESTLLIPSPGASSNQQADSARPPWEEPRRTEHTTSEPSVAQPDELRDVVRTLMERMNAIERPPPYVDESRARNTRSASG